MARPKKEVKRGAAVSCYPTDSEREIIQSQAKRAGLSMSAFLVQTAVAPGLDPSPRYVFQAEVVEAITRAERSLQSLANQALGLREQRQTIDLLVALLSIERRLAVAVNLQVGHKEPGRSGDEILEGRIEFAKSDRGGSMAESDMAAQPAELP